MIRVLVVGHDRAAAEGIAGALAAADGVEASHAVGGHDGVLRELARPGRGSLDAVVTVGRLPEAELLGLARELRDREGESPHLVVTGLPATEEVILRYLEAGVDGYLTEELAVSGLLMVLRLLDRGGTLVSPWMARRLVRRVQSLASLLDRSGVDVSGMTELTPREREVLELVADGLSNREIASRLYISVGTVKTHVHHILKKLGAPSREDARRLLVLWRTQPAGED